MKNLFGLETEKSSTPSRMFVCLKMTVIFFVLLASYCIPLMLIIAPDPSLVPMWTLVTMMYSLLFGIPPVFMPKVQLKELADEIQWKFLKEMSSVGLLLRFIKWLILGALVIIWGLTEMCVTRKK